MPKPKCIVIFGATCTGKTWLSLDLAKKYSTEIISADSRQVYKYLDIGTAKPSKDELLLVNHHFVDFLTPNELYSAGNFEKDAHLVIDNLNLQGKVPIIVGGSTLYINSIFNPIDTEGTNERLIEIRKNLNFELEKNGLDILYKQLKDIDLASAQLYSDKNPRRIIRALEYFYFTGNKISEVKKTSQSMYDIFAINVFKERELLYKDINNRCLEMLKNGLIDETKNILNMGYSKELNSLNTVGYKEVLMYLENKLSTSEMTELFQQKSRNYAKRQVTYFKKIHTNFHIDLSIIVEKENNLIKLYKSINIFLNS
jgi:tRNA dimethylallyltransferase